MLYSRGRDSTEGINKRAKAHAEQYIMALYDLAENCEYGDMKSEMLRDRLVVRIRDQSLSEKLQMDSDLTLEKAKKQIGQREAVHEQQQELKGDEPSSADAVQRGGRRYYKRQRQSGVRNAPRKIPSVKKCMRCGKESHPREQCPAKDAECHRCKRKGHYEAVCRSKTVAGAMSADAMDVAFLDNVSPGKQETIWLATIQLNGKQIPFKLDTGAEVTAISDATHQRLG